MKSPRVHRRSGFTLIEILAVLIIISILAYFLIGRLGKTDDIVKQGVARSQLENIAAVLNDYETDKGDFPPSSFKSDWGAPPNTTNLGCEALFMALWQPGLEGGGIEEDRLVNLDGDALPKRLTVNASLELFELGDPWENSIAYFHHRDYERKDLYVTQDPSSGEELSSEVLAHRSSKTGNWANPHSFQLISAGPDGLFGNDDDVTNFER